VRRHLCANKPLPPYTHESGCAQVHGSEQGKELPGSDRGPMRIQFSRNPLGEFRGKRPRDDGGYGGPGGAGGYGGAPAYGSQHAYSPDPAAAAQYGAPAAGGDAGAGAAYAGSPQQVHLAPAQPEGGGAAAAGGPGEYGQPAAAPQGADYGAQAFAAAQPAPGGDYGQGARHACAWLVALILVTEQLRWCGSSLARCPRCAERDSMWWCQAQAAVPDARCACRPTSVGAHALPLITRVRFDVLYLSAAAVVPEQVAPSVVLASRSSA
jgi:hypothetical protein